ncbi:MAG: F0F1 ATP synthase subunit alpha [Lachnospiraceae bacterium]|nr:F0F1 ATP synthase subunit alpha [Lachnospiraceae bacterium]
MENSKTPEEKELTAYIFCAEEPSDTQKTRLKAFIAKKYEKKYELEWIETKTLTPGFKLQVGYDVYDWTRAGRFRQLKDLMEEARAMSTGEPEDLITLYKTSIADWHATLVAEEDGEVVSVGDGIVHIEGLPGATYGEVILFESGVKGMVQDLKEDDIGVILFGGDDDVVVGSRARRTKKTAGIPVGDAYLGRIVNALGEPIDNKGPIKNEGYRVVESPAPTIIDRQPVNRPMNTGILSIDSMFPIGRGQRELIIGDRQTGKTTIATDTILNQKGKGVICVYVAIGQKASSVAQLAHMLAEKGAMEYTIIVSASASEPASVQYIAPYAATSLAEYFMHKGDDVLIVYDDLSKHAIAYRSLSLLLERSPGREAYPGDVFYLHSRLLERSAHLSDELGGGSITALPIVETQAGDVSAYIPTNIISITDGQIFLESSLFYSGQRPAVNVGLSVSRVGGAAQTKAMKKATGTLRLDLAQFREMEIFLQFSNDLDEPTREKLNYGQGLMRLLRQRQENPFSESDQVIILVCAMDKLFLSTPLEEISDVRENLLEYMEEEIPDVIMRINSEGMLSDEDREKIRSAAEKYQQKYLSKAD